MDVDKKIQAKHVETLPILRFLESLGTYDGKSGVWGTWCSGWDNSVRKVVPDDVPDKVLRAKMGALIRSGLIDGCGCGCRGDYELKDKGREFIKQASLKED